MKTHELKLNIEFCIAVLNGEKIFEIRKNDRDYQKGDHIKFIPVQRGLFFTHLPCIHDISQKEYEITYVLNGWGLKDDYVALAIREVKSNDM